MATRTIQPLTVSKVAENAKNFFSSNIHSSAVTIFTPFGNRVPLNDLEISNILKKFIKMYEPKIAKEGLYPTQAEFLKTYMDRADKNYILSTATGSGKSLCFWSWVIDQLSRDTDATAILCFPTQALMWSQADRIAKMSDKETLAKQGILSWGGNIEIGNKRIGWSVWKGVGRGEARDESMRAHMGTDTFKNARIRIATLDKAHFSLLSESDYVKRLSCFVIDEAHMYHGMFGANVHFFLKRLFAACELCGCERPKVFLSSATLSDAIKFGQDIADIDSGEDIILIEDSIKQEIDLVAFEKAIKMLDSPPKGGLLRVVFLLDEEHGKSDNDKFLKDSTLLGSNLNVIYFSESKFYSKILAQHLKSKRKSDPRKPIIYDADLPPQQRRKLEQDFNSGKAQGITLLATNALELGVDIEGLDICVIDKLPPARQDLLQRIGRVGRREGQPGLVILSASMTPHDRRLITKPKEFFRLDTTKTLPLPKHVDMLRWKHIMAAFNEGIYREYSNKNWSRLKPVRRDLGSHLHMSFIEKIKRALFIFSR